jgi:hypothetical protein
VWILGSKWRTEIHNINEVLLIVDCQASKGELFQWGKTYRRVHNVLMYNDISGSLIYSRKFYQTCFIQQIASLFCWWQSWNTHLLTLTHTHTHTQAHTHVQGIPVFMEFIMRLDLLCLIGSLPHHQLSTRVYFRINQSSQFVQSLSLVSLNSGPRISRRYLKSNHFLLVSSGRQVSSGWCGLHNWGLIYHR